MRQNIKLKILSIIGVLLFLNLPALSSAHANQFLNHADSTLLDTLNSNKNVEDNRLETNTGDDEYEWAFIVGAPKGFTKNGQWFTIVVKRVMYKPLPFGLNRQIQEDETITIHEDSPGILTNNYIIAIAYCRKNT